MKNNRTMKALLSLLVAVLVFTGCSSQNFKDGDIIFHTSKSNQSKMIQLVTGSNLTHCGIIFHKDGKAYVYEAVNPVKVTSLSKWIARGVDGKYKVVRLKYNLQDNHKKTMVSYAKAQMGKSYDMKFQWSDSKMYCSELVWKIYSSTGYTLSDPKSFSDYDLSADVVRSEIKKRYGTTINPSEKIVSPVDLYNSPIVRTVYSNY